MPGLPFGGAKAAGRRACLSQIPIRIDMDLGAAFDAAWSESWGELEDAGVWSIEGCCLVVLTLDPILQAVY